MERAGQRRAVVRFASAEHRAPVRAGVDQAVQLAAAVAGDHHRLAADVGGEVVAGVGNLCLVGEVDPVALEDVLHLQFEDVLVGEDAAVGAIHARGLVFDDGVGEDGRGVVQGLGHWVPPLTAVGSPQPCIRCPPSQWKDGCVPLDKNSRRAVGETPSGIRRSPRHALCAIAFPTKCRGAQQPR